MPNLDPWINQKNQTNSNENEKHMATKTITNKFENHLLSIRDERQKMFILTHILPIMNVMKRL